jgi:hypothetical protein
LRAIDRADRWPDDVRLFDIEGRFTCTACGKRGADVRSDFNWSAGWAIAKAITGVDQLPLAAPQKEMESAK